MLSKSVGTMSTVNDNRSARERAKAIAEQHRAERRLRKRRCVLCAVEESERTPLGAHPDGLGPSCKDLDGCELRARTRSS